MNTVAVRAPCVAHAEPSTADWCLRIVHSRGSSVLVIEEHPFQRRALARRLHELGVSRVLEAGSAQALDQVAAHSGSIALILSSLDVPEMDRLELLRGLAAKAPRISVAILGAFGRAELGRISAEASAHGLHLIGLLEKPVSDDALRAVLVRALAASRATSVIATPVATGAAPGARRSAH